MFQIALFKGFPNIPHIPPTPPFGTLSGQTMRQQWRRPLKTLRVGMKRNVPGRYIFCAFSFKIKGF